MIYPAAIFRIVGFLKDGTVFNEPQDGGLTLCYTDSGAPVVVELTSNKGKVTANDVIRCIEAKRDSVIKTDKIKLLAASLEDDEEFFQQIETHFKDVEAYQSADRAGKRKLEKEYAFKEAEKRILNDKTIGKNSIIRVAANDTDRTYKIGEKEYPVYQSRSLLFENDIPTKFGLYFFSQADNMLPVVISPIFNKEGEFLNLLKVNLGKIAGINHFNFLCGHIRRTLENGKCFYSNISYDYERAKKLPIFQSIKRLNEIFTSKDEKLKDEYLALLDQIKEEVNKNPKLIIILQLSLGMLIDAALWQKFCNELNPLNNLKNTLINLTYSKQNPDVKEELSKIVDKRLREIAECRIPFEVEASYTCLIENGDSWGYMTNNIGEKGLILSMKDTKLIADMLEEYVS